MRLILEDGAEYAGSCFGLDEAVSGEVVFNTGMTGYIETLTDPSYRGQILVMTYPLVGNYGVPPPREQGSMHKPYEADRIQVQGLVVQNYVDDHSHYAGKRSLKQWLCEEDVPAITGIDTRALTRRLREHGTMRGYLIPEGKTLNDVKESAKRVDMQREVFDLVAPKRVTEHPGGELNVLVIDAGCKDNIVRCLNERGASVTRVPWHGDIAALAEKADGIVIGNGPGDPKNLMPLVETIRGLLSTYEKPIFGICLGNQILSLAAGANTVKLPYGHRGVNQPVQDLLTRRSFITSQNHGYAVDDDSLPDDWEPWFVNINDGTNEGVRCRTRPFFSVQFHPEACPGPEDTAYLFDDYLRLVGSMRSGGRS